MRLTREKIVRISHQLSDLLVASNEVEFVEDRDTIRQHMVQTMTNVLREEEKVEVEVRKRITSQKKEILEGSEEWDVLYRKYYSEELRRMGISAVPEEHQQSQHTVADRSALTRDEAFASEGNEAFVALPCRSRQLAGGSPAPTLEVKG
jgi:hypothetical protein